jgi:myo-inositol-1-phosphate synthase
MTQEQTQISSAEGTLGVLLPGMGAVATTFMAGVEAVRRGIGQPFGSLTQMGTIRLGGRPEKRVPKIRDFVPIAGLDQLVFGAWDVFPDDAYESARNAGVLGSSQVEELADFLRTIRPMRGAFDQRYVKKLNGTHIIESRSKRAWADQLIDDIERFREANACDRMVMVWCGSTEVFMQPTAVHQDLDAFEKGLDADDDSIPPSMIYAYAALKCGIPYANGAPNLSADVPALLDLADQNGVPVSGKDFKTGQTLMKTILAPGFKARMLGIRGWYSTNILGNRAGRYSTTPSRSRPKRNRSWACSISSFSRSFIRSCTATSLTSCASTTIHRAATTKKVGTTSTSSGG